MKTHAHTRLGETDLLLDPSGALYCPAADVLIVADLHFEKGRSIGLRTRRPLPPYDTNATLRKLALVVTAYEPSTIVCLGDSFHDLASVARSAEEIGSIVGELATGRRWIWIQGNHDPALPSALGGEIADSFSSGGLLFRHDDGGRDRPQEAAPMVIGHYHPVAVAVLGGRVYRRPCFVSNGKILVMPSFGAYTGGLNILHPDMSRVLGPTYEVWLLGSAGVHRVSRTKLVLNPPMPFGSS